MTEQRHSELDLHPIEFAPGEEHAALLRRQQVVRRAKIAGLVMLLILMLGAARTVISRFANASVLEARSVEQSKLYVRTTQAKRADAGRTLALPGTLQGYVQSPLAARASGYLKRWSKDIGSRVEKG